MVHQEEWENALAILQQPITFLPVAYVLHHARNHVFLDYKEPAIENIEKILSKRFC
jgi:hypothetical protein